MYKHEVMVSGFASGYDKEANALLVNFPTREGFTITKVIGAQEVSFGKQVYVRGKMLTVQSNVVHSRNGKQIVRTLYVKPEHIEVVGGNV